MTYPAWRRGLIPVIYPSIGGRMNIPQDLERQIEEAFHYRGHVTVALKNGTAIEGFLYNRQFGDQKNQQASYVELVVKNKDENRRLAVADIESVALTGEDAAAGKS